MSGRPPVGRPPAGIQPRWRVLYDLVRDVEPGTTVPYDTLADAVEVKDRHALYKLMSRVIRELWERDQRSMAVVRGGGYRMMLATEHEAQAGRFRDASGRKMRDGLAVLKATRLGELDEAGRKRAVAATVVLEGLVQRIEGISERQQQTEDVLASVIRRVEKLEQPVIEGEVVDADEADD